MMEPCHLKAMISMAMVKSIVIAIALVLQFCISDAGICTVGPRPEKDRSFCPQNLMETSSGSLPCTETSCNDQNMARCELSGRKQSDTILNFTSQMCVTNSKSARYVGLKFRWALPAGHRNITGLKILVHHQDYPLSWILLAVDLTGIVSSEEEKVFSTDCLASNDIHPGRNYFISVQVSQSDGSSKRYQFPQPISYNPNCSRPHPQERHLCAAPPDYRPMPKAYCNGTVAVTVDSGFPPGIGSDTNEFQVEVLLVDMLYNNFLGSQIITQEVTLAKPAKKVVYFHNLDPGVYLAKMAFLDEDGLPCGDNFYRQENQTSVNAPPTIDVSVESPNKCNGDVEVTVAANSNKGNQDHKFNVTVILSDTNGQEITKTELLKIMNNKTLSALRKVKIFRVPPGNYTVSTKFADGYYSKCSSDETQELYVPYCPTVSSHFPTNPSPMKFWDVYGKLILGVGILSIFLSVLAFLFHHKWLKLKMKIAEQQKRLTDDRNSSADGLSSVADTTALGSHMRRYLHDIGQGWPSQNDCTTTELKYNHQPTSADSGLPSDEYESCLENESVAAFSL